MSSRAAWITAGIAAAATIIAALIGVVPQFLKHSPEPSGHVLRFGVPENSTLDNVRQIVGGKLNVSIVFSSVCSQKATQARLDGAQIDGDPSDPAAIIRDVLARVKDNAIRYEVVEIEPLRRYEIRCF